jgi:hypothetical protein
VLRLTGTAKEVTASVASRKANTAVKKKVDNQNRNTKIIVSSRSHIFSFSNIVMIFTVIKLYVTRRSNMKFMSAGNAAMLP